MAGDESGRDLSKIFDLNRTVLTKDMVTRIEGCLRQIDGAQEDLKQVVADCKEAEFSPRDIVAMKKLAKIRLRDKASEARDQLEALRRIGRVVDFDLFDWADAQ